MFVMAPLTIVPIPVTLIFVESKSTNVVSFVTSIDAKVAIPLTYKSVAPIPPLTCKV